MTTFSPLSTRKHWLIDCLTALQHRSKIGTVSSYRAVNALDKENLAPLLSNGFYGAIWIELRNYGDWWTMFDYFHRVSASTQYRQETIDTAIPTPDDDSKKVIRFRAPDCFSHERILHVCRLLFDVTSTHNTSLCDGLAGEENRLRRWRIVNEK